MVETRSQAQGKPLKKPGAYNTDLYYQEKDEGFGDVGVDQEPDAGALDNPEDPEFQVTKDEIAAAEGRQMEEDRAAEQDIAQQPGEDRDVRGEVADLKNEATDLKLQGERVVEGEGEPVPIVEDPTTLDEADAGGPPPTERDA